MVFTLVENEERILEYFTFDGAELIKNYLQSLKKYVNNVVITKDQQDSVISVITDFIDEYHENYKPSKISFTYTLILINELGSPMEIIQSFEFEVKSEIETKDCVHCGWKNSLNSVYCEYCGKLSEDMNETTKTSDSYFKISNYKSDFKQSMIDYPYSRSFIIFELFFS